MISTNSGPRSNTEGERVLALDLGTKRVGVAISDPLGLTAQGLATLARQGGRRDQEAILRLVQQYGVWKVIVGLPLRLDGTSGPAAEAARGFAADLEAALSIPVEMWDERLTTAQVEATMTRAGVRRSRRKQHRDRLAAVVLLQSWLDSKAISQE